MNKPLGRSFAAIVLVVVLVVALALALGASHRASADVPIDQPQAQQRSQEPCQQQLKQTLGYQLFSDVRLSVNNDYSCASCHQPDRYFTDGLPVALGALDQKLLRNTPTLLNVAQQASLGWTDDGVTDLATQHKRPLLNTQPIELGFAPARAQLLTQDISLNQLRIRAFPQSTKFDLDVITAALAAYVATLSYTSGFDRYLKFDDAGALSDAAKRGLVLFTSERTQCVACHNGPGLGGGYRLAGSPADTNAELLLPARYEQRRVAEGLLAIRVPSLRAVTFTAPYMIDGRLPDLASVLAFYQSGVVPELPSFTLTEEETQDLLAFLQQL